MIIHMLTCTFDLVDQNVHLINEMICIIATSHFYKIINLGPSEDAETITNHMIAEFTKGYGHYNLS